MADVITEVIVLTVGLVAGILLAVIGIIPLKPQDRTKTAIYLVGILATFLCTAIFILALVLLGDSARTIPQTPDLTQTQTHLLATQLAATVKALVPNLAEKVGLRVS